MLRLALGLSCALALSAAAQPAPPSPAASAAPAPPPAAVAPAPAAPEIPTLRSLSAAERGSLELPMLEGLLRRSKADELIALAREAVAALGTYGVTVTKQERVEGELVGPQTFRMTLRPSPYAVVMRYTEGQGKGRVVLYDETLRKHELRVRETGFKGLLGALWLDIDSSLTRQESNHPVTDNGYARLLYFLSTDLERAKASGGHKRSDEPLTSRTKWCSVLTAPAGAKGLRGDVTRVCFDPVRALPVSIEVNVKGELLESYSYEALKPGLTGSEADFSLAAAGL